MATAAKITIIEPETQERPEAAIPTGMELVLSKGISATLLFNDNGLGPILERIETEARSAALDISTPKGRKDVASLAYKIARSKSAIDELGKELVSGWKEKAKKVDAERARARDRLEALQAEIRQPLTDWENADKERIARHEAAISAILEIANTASQNWQSLPLQEMKNRLAQIAGDTTDWKEFSVRAKQACEAALSSLSAAILRRQSYDAEQAELARLRKEEEERKQRAHEERLKAEAADKARREAEVEAKRAADAEASRVRVEQEKAEQERKRLEREAADANARAAKAEADRIAADQKAKRDAEAAALRERERIEAQQRADAEAAAKRETDRAHRASIHNAALQAFTSAGITSDIARQVVEVIARGIVPHISIAY